MKELFLLKEQKMKLYPHITRLVFLSIVLLSLGVSCKDKKNTKSFCEENPGSCQSVIVAKEFFLFKEGSWWVYEEETSHERDSMYVTQYYNSDGYDFDMRIKSNLTEFEYHYYPLFASGNQSCSQVSPVSGKCIYIKRSKSKLGEYIGEDNCFFVNYRKDDWTYAYNNIYFENNKIIVENIFDNYSLGALSFSQTVKIHELSTVVEGIQPTNHYFAKGIGLVRKELIDSNQVWNLVSYHIEP